MVDRVVDCIRQSLTRRDSVARTSLPTAVSPEGSSPTLDESMWSSPGAGAFKLRGKKYLRDKKKVSTSSTTGRLHAF